MLARKVLKSYGLYKKDLKYFKVKKKILQKLGCLPESKQFYEEKHLDLLNNEYGDELVRNALEVWEQVQLEELNLWKLDRAEREEKENRMINSDGEMEISSDVDFFEIQKEAKRHGLI